MKPVLYPQAFLENKIRRKWEMRDGKSKRACFMKYFPKYYKYLDLENEDLFNRSLQFKVKQLKIVKVFYSNMGFYDGQEKIVKRLFRSCRKTLKRLSSSYWGCCQSLSLYSYFPRINMIDLRNYQYDSEIIQIFVDRHGGGNLATSSLLFWKLLKRFCAHFWGGNQFVETLRILCSNYTDLLIIKKLNKSMKFLSFLKTLSLHIQMSNRITENEANDLLILLGENKDFLRYVTHLRIEFSNGVSLVDWELVQSIINCCPQISCLSFPITYQIKPYPPSFERDLSLNLNSFPRLRVLGIEVSDLETFIKGVKFSSSIQEVTLTYSRSKDRPKEIFDFRDINEDTKNWESFEQYKFIGGFFEKWKELKNLKVLNLNVYWIENMNIIMKMFILPLLRVNSQLEILNFEVGLNHEDGSEEDKIFDLDIFFEGIKSLSYLKNLKIKPWHQDRNVIAIYTPQKPFFLPRLSLLDISFESFIRFDGSQFFKGLFHSLKSHPTSENIKIKFTEIRFDSAAEVIELAKILSLASRSKNLEITLQGSLHVQNDDFTLDSQFLREIPKNVELKVSVDCPDISYFYSFGKDT